MDENSCENETEESVDDKEKKKAKTDPQVQDFTAKLSLTGKPTRSQVSNRRESPVDAQGPSTNFHPLILKHSGAIQAISDNTDSEEPVGVEELEEIEQNVQPSATSLSETEQEVQGSAAEVEEMEQTFQQLVKQFEKTEKKVQQLAGPVEETEQKVQQSSQTRQEGGMTASAPAPVSVPASVPVRVPIQEYVGLPRETATHIPPTHNLREALMQTVPIVSEGLSVKGVGPPPSYSFVMKQKKRLKAVPSPDTVLSNRSPPPNYAGTRGLYITSQERTFGFPSFAEPVWRSHSQPALCPRCGIIVLTTAHSHESIATHVAALALCLFGCWPCCLLPYCMNVCKNTYHYCPICQAFLGLYTPW